MTSVRRIILSVVAMFALSACSDTSDDAAPAESGTRADSGAQTTSASDATRAADAASEGTDRGTLSLAVDGQDKSFSYFPTDKNMTLSMSTMVLAKPSPEATEAFSIVVMSFDLDEAELPATLELGLREAMQSENPSQFASSPKPMISYISPAGVEYSSYATVVFEDYEDGVLAGRVEDRELEPSDGDGPPILLSDVRFEVSL